MRVSKDVVSVYSKDGEAALLNIHGGAWLTLSPDAAYFWSQLETGVDIDAAVAAVADYYEETKGAVQTELRPVIELLFFEGFLLAEAETKMAEVHMSTPMTGTGLAIKGLPRRMRCVAALSLVLSLIVQRLPLWLRLKLLRVLAKLPGGPATLSDAELLVACIRWVGQFYPGRAACLELSVPTFIAGALQGQRVTWCAGIRFDPIVNHAWIEVDGQPVGEREAERWPFKAAIRI